MSCRDGVEKVRYRDLFTLPSGEVLENLHPSEPKQQCLVWSENHLKYGLETPSFRSYCYPQVFCGVCRWGF